MRTIHNLKNHKQFKKNLRNNSTKEETILWHYLKSKKLGAKFHRQQGIGKYIVDFYCPSKKLIIKLDGGQHNKDENYKYDKTRNKYLKSLGLKILRIGNYEITENIDGVLEEISHQLNDN